MATKLCLAVPSNTSLVPLSLSPCNKTSELQKWACRNETLLTLGEEDLFLLPANGHKDKVILSKTPSSKSTWKIYGTKDSLCSKGYEALFTLEGNSLGAPCVFPFKYMNKWHAKCITDDDENTRLWCGTTADVNKDSLTGYCPVKGLASGTDADYWIGLNNLDFDSGWKWAGNHPFPYLNWAPGSPSPESEKICGSMQSKNGNWVNYKCDQKLGYICKKENSSLDSSVIPAEPTDVLWIGLNDQKTQMNFEWSDGTPVRFTKWQQGEPTHVKNIQEDCVIMSGENGSWGDYYCEDEFGYICKRKPLSSVPEEAEPVDPKCQKGFFSKTHKKKTWFEARDFCREIGGDLASIHSPEEEHIIEELYTLKTRTKRYFRWMDGSPVTYVAWAPDEPNFANDDENYAILSHHETALPGSGYTHYGNSSYSLVSPKMTWEDARKKCKSENSELASILNPYTQSFLWLLVLKYKEPVWIGLNSNLINEKYKWISTWKLIYTNWAAGEPKKKTACVYVDLDGHWKTGACNETYFYICEKYHGIIPTDPPEVPGRCPESKESHRSWIPFRGHCYAIYPIMVTWPIASMRCAHLGGTLTSIEDLAEVNFLLEHTRQFSLMDFWIGLFKNVEGEWIWQDNTELDFMNWKDAPPGTHSRSYYHDAYKFTFRDQCISMNGQNGEWFGEGCDYPQKGFICKTSKKQAKAPPSAHGTIVIVVLLVMLILISAGIAVYIFYKRRRRQLQTTAGFGNSLYQDNIVILRNDSDSLVDNKTGD
ncbi:hypothetical protein JD844_003271 [Phrynosoma platyrhinos]|uniref:Macrophage mannose receptor 1-like n=1 Tax=Phrynosoma platyrhinos TaxID=52577 RepID=A0ABQ7TDI6_PHRPL|nr:hypothetical protein JD844_003271 [Phrynosoma platyrhinos]